MNTSIAENFMRSANAPAIKTPVMIANVSWNNRVKRFWNGLSAKCDTVILFASFHDRHAIEQHACCTSEVRHCPA